MAGPLVFIFLLAKGLSGKTFTKEASLYLIVSAGLQVVLGMYVGQHMRDKIAAQTFKKLVLLAVIAAGADLLRHGFFS